MEDENKTSCTDVSREEVEWELRRKPILHALLRFFEEEGCTVSEALDILADVKQLIPQLAKVNADWPQMQK